MIKKEITYMAWSTFLKKNELSINKDITPEVLIQELGIEWEVGSYKFNVDDLHRAVKHFKIRPKKTQPPQNRELQVFELGDNHYAFIVQNKHNNVSSSLVTAIKKSTKEKIKLNRIKDGLCEEKNGYPILDYWNSLKSFADFNYSMDLTNAFREEMSRADGGRILILPIDNLTKAIIEKIEKNTIKGQ